MMMMMMLIKQKRKSGIQFINPLKFSNRGTKSYQTRATKQKKKGVEEDDS